MWRGHADLRSQHVEVRLRSQHVEVKPQFVPPLTFETSIADVVPVADCCCVTGWPVGPCRTCKRPGLPCGFELLRCGGGMLLRCGVGMLICGRSMLKCGCGRSMLKCGMLNGPALAAPLGANANVPTIAK